MESEAIPRGFPIEALVPTPLVTPDKPEPAKVETMPTKEQFWNKLINKLHCGIARKKEGGYDLTKK